MGFQEYASFMLKEGKDAEKLRKRSQEYELARQKTEALQPVLAALDRLDADHLELISDEAVAIRKKTQPRFDGEPLEIKVYAGQTDGRLFLVAPVEVDEKSLFLEAATLGHIQESLRSNGKKVKKTIEGGFAGFTVNVDDPKEVKRIMAALVEPPESLTQANVVVTIEYGTFASLQGNGQRALSAASRKALPAALSERVYKGREEEKVYKRDDPKKTKGDYSRKNGRGLDDNILAYFADNKQGTKKQAADTLDEYSKNSVGSRIDVLRREGYLQRIQTEGKEAVYSPSKKKVEARSKRTEEDGTFEHTLPEQPRARSGKVTIAKGVSVDADPEEVRRIERGLLAQKDEAQAAGLNPVEKKVLSHAGERQGQVPYSRAADSLGLPIETVRGAAKSLEEKGMINAGATVYALRREGKKTLIHPSAPRTTSSPPTSYKAGETERSVYAGELSTNASNLLHLLNNSTIVTHASVVHELKLTKGQAGDAYDELHRHGLAVAVDGGFKYEMTDSGASYIIRQETAKRRSDHVAS